MSGSGLPPPPFASGLPPPGLSSGLPPPPGAGNLSTGFSGLPPPSSGGILPPPPGAVGIGSPIGGLPPPPAGLNSGLPPPPSEELGLSSRSNGLSGLPPSPVGLNTRNNSNDILPLSTLTTNNGTSSHGITGLPTPPGVMGSGKPSSLPPPPGAGMLPPPPGIGGLPPPPGAGGLPPPPSSGGLTPPPVASGLPPPPVASGLPPPPSSGGLPPPPRSMGSGKPSGLPPPPGAGVLRPPPVASGLPPPPGAPLSTGTGLPPPPGSQFSSGLPPPPISHMGSRLPPPPGQFSSGLPPPPISQAGRGILPPPPGGSGLPPPPISGGLPPPPNSVAFASRGPSSMGVPPQTMTSQYSTGNLNSVRRSADSQGPEGSLLRTCEVCNTPCKERFVFACGCYYHPACLQCARCKKQLIPPRAVSYRGQLMCLECTRRPQDLEKCPVCNEAMTDQKDIVKPSGLRMRCHKDCFRCYECGCKLDVKEFDIVGNQPLCQKCNAAAMDRTCKECGEPIIGRFVKERGSYFHIDHFTCYMCGRVLNGKAYMVHHNKYLCQEHGVLYLKTCGYCKGEINAIDSVRVRWGNKYYHKRCFVCRICGCPLENNNKTRSCHGRPHCEECFNQRVKAGEVNEEGRCINKNHKHSPSKTIDIRIRFKEESKNKENWQEPMYRSEIPIANEDSEEKKSKKKSKSKSRHKHKHR